MTSMSNAARRLSLRAHLGPDKHADALGTLYFALFKGDPFGAGIEPTSTGAYARVAVLNDATMWGTIAAGQVSVSSAAAVTWPAATGLWSITDGLTHWAVFDNSTGGNLWYGGPLTTPITVTGATDQPRIPAGSLSVTQAG
jgi:hypothetical protein